MGGQGRGWTGGDAGVQQHDAGSGETALCHHVFCSVEFMAQGPNNKKIMS